MAQMMSNGFEDARDKGLQPLMLLPGRPPQSLALDVPLQEAGVKPGESKVSCRGGGGTVSLAGQEKRGKRGEGEAGQQGLLCRLCRRWLHKPAHLSATVQVNLTVAFQQLVLQPDELAMAVPNESNPALLRCPATRMFLWLLLLLRGAWAWDSGKQGSLIVMQVPARGSPPSGPCPET